MDYWKASTHAQTCLFQTLPEVHELRLKSNEQYKSILKSRYPLLDIEPISVDEEYAILRFYLSKIPTTCSFYKMPPSVSTVASWFLIRYSLRHSWMEWDPKHVMLSCILVASKCENLHLTATQFPGALPNTNLELICQLEMVIIAALDYNLHFFTPLLPLTGIAMQEGGGGGRRWDGERWKTVRATCEKICATDAVLLYSPRIIAYLACLLNDVPLPSSADMIDFDRDAAKALCQELLAYQIDTEQIKAVDRRLIQIRKTTTSTPSQV